MDNDVLGRTAYQAYGQALDHKTHEGLPMPAWEDLGDTIRRAWSAAADAVVTVLLGEV